MSLRTDSAIAVNRFGLGARPGELAGVDVDPRGWLLAQLAGGPPAIADASLRSSADIVADAFELRQAAGALRRARRMRGQNDPAAAPAPDRAAVRKVLDVARRHRAIYADEVEARTHAAIATDRPFVERLTHFWTNHFAVSADKPAVVGLVGAFEREAIRPHVLGRFTDLLLAAERHPAMLVYLDNHLSIGPDSRAARLANRRRNGRELGLNENLAREILELHTLGVDGGYTQRDVTQLAEVLTGWSIGGARGPGLGGRVGASEPLTDDEGAAARSGTFAFRAALHEPGAKHVLGKRYADDGAAQGEAVLRDLAAHPATAQLIATKLVRHFVADEPPATAVARVAKTFVETGGDLVSVYRSLVEAPEAWQEPLAKYKTPSDYVVSTLRGLDASIAGDAGAHGRSFAAAFELLGQRPYTPGSPAGWPDRSSDWDGASALLKRIEWADTVAQRAGARVAAAELAPQLLGGTLRPETAAAIARAETAQQALTLLLAAPEFLRR